MRSEAEVGGGGGVLGFVVDVEDLGFVLDAVLGLEILPDELVEFRVGLGNSQITGEITVV